MLKVVMLIIFSVNLIGGVDIILKSFDNINQAQSEKMDIENFLKQNSISSKVKIESIDNIFYIKIGPFNDSIRDNEELLATVALKYPNMMIIPHKVSSKNYSPNINKSENNIIQKNSSMIQWLIIIIMAIWSGVILFLRFKTVKRVKKEQKIITKEQNSIENSLNQTKRMSDEI